MPHVETIVMDRDRSSPDSDRREGRRRSMGRDSRDSERRRDDRPDFGLAAKEAERQRNNERPEPGQIIGDNSKPVDFRTLAISNWNEDATDDEIEEGLFQSCKKYGDFTVKVMNQGAFRVAYVNFRFPEDAADAKHHLTDVVMFDRPLRADPVYSAKRGRSRSPADGYRNKFPRGGGGGRTFHGRSSSPGSNMGRGGYNRHTEGHPGMNRERNMGGGSGGGVGHFENRRNSGGREGYHGEPKFPFHLDHVPPEEDANATRTLFVGNLDLESEPEEIRRIFTRFGIVEDVDVKRPAKGQGNAYAFVRFLNLDMSHQAKVQMSGKYINRYQCKIGYGKAQPTNCLWIGGLGPWIRGETLEREFDRFGVIHRIEWPQGKNFAYVLYDNVDAATAACQEMRGFPLGGPDRRLRVDFSDPNHLQMAFDEMSIPARPPQDYRPNDGGDMYDGPAPYNREPQGRDRGYEDDWHRGGRGGYREGRSRGGPPSQRGRNDWGPRDRGDYRDDRQDDGYHNNRRDNFGHRGNERRGYRGRGAYHGDRGYDRNTDNQYERRGGAGGDFRDPPPMERNNDRHYNREYSPPNKNRRTPPVDYQRRNERERAPMEPRETNGRRTSESRDGFSPSVLQVDNLTDLIAELPCVWSGALVLKNSAFAAKMYLLLGEVSIVDHLMRDPTSTEMPLLKIMQRLRLDQPKLEEVGRRVSTTTNHAVLLAIPGSTQTVEESNTNIQQRPLRNLVSYLKQKEAAGVITLPPVSGNRKPIEAGVLHAFPPCQFSHGYLTKRAPKLGADPVKDDHLVVVVVQNDV